MASTSSRRVIGALEKESTVFFLCDMQERFRRLIVHYPDIINVAKLMVDSAKLIGVPVLGTEHNPHTELGPTVKDIDTSYLQGKIFPKHTLSMVRCQEFDEALRKLQGIKSVVIFGVWADVCVFNTSLDLLERNYEVHVVADGVSSRHQSDRMIALDRLRQSGVFVSTARMILNNLMKDSLNPVWDEIRTHINSLAPDKGLANAYGSE